MTCHRFLFHNEDATHEKESGNEFPHSKTFTAGNHANLGPERWRSVKGHDFPGNVRELKNIIERAAYRDVGIEIAPEDLGLSTREDFAPSGGAFQDRLDGFARRLVRDALKQSAL